MNKSQSDYYYGGNRLSQIHHSRMRLKCSPLNDFFFRCNLIESPQCACGAPTENVANFLLECPRYEQVRSDTLGSLTTLEIGVLLHSDLNKSYDWNSKLFHTVQEFILTSKRFNVWYERLLLWLFLPYCYLFFLFIYNDVPVFMSVYTSRFLKCYILYVWRGI